VPAFTRLEAFCRLNFEQRGHTAINFDAMLFLASILEYLQQADLWLLLLINQSGGNTLFDVVMPVLRLSLVWVPFYLYLFSWGIMNLGAKGKWWVIGATMTVALSDRISSGFFKPIFARLRPCNDPDVMDQIILRLPRCSEAFSFTSSHAANHFALAMFIYLTLAPLCGKKMVRWMFAWAAAICYAQMYVGVHYPIDIFGGMAVGLFSGWLVAKVYGRATQPLV
jgi:undecaprenyl-diphosphatase